MNVRKAQKHMQRARELLNQSQLGFGTGDGNPDNHVLNTQPRSEEMKRDQFKGLADNTQLQIFSKIEACEPICNLAQVSTSLKQKNKDTCKRCKLVVQQEINKINELSKSAQVRLRSYNKMPEVPVQAKNDKAIPMRKLRSDELNLKNSPFKAGKSFANPALAQKLSETVKKPQTEQELEHVTCEHGPNTDVTYGLLSVIFNKSGGITVDLDSKGEWIQMEIEQHPECEVWISDRCHIKNPVELYSMIDIKSLVEIALENTKLARKVDKYGQTVYFDPRYITPPK